jgi:hypothetical protein
MSLLTSNLIGVKHDLDKADMMIAKSYVDEAIQRIEALEAEVAKFKTCSYSMCHMWKLRDGSA